MAMAVLQRLAARTVQRSQCSMLGSSRAHHSLSVSPHSQSSGLELDPILFPRVASLGVEIFGAPAPIGSQFKLLMAVPKRKVTPSRKGKRNGPKALKPVPVVAKCKVCGRIKLPHLYCCSGEAKVVDG